MAPLPRPDTDKPPAYSGRPPTHRQLQVLSMLDQWIKINNGLSPTYRELAKWCKVKSVRTIQEHVYYLMRKGLIAANPLELRSFFITELGAKALKLAPAKTIPVRVLY